MSETADNQQCLAGCVAYITGNICDGVPDFAASVDWVLALRDWLATEGRSLEITERMADLSEQQVVGIHGDPDAAIGHAVVWEREADIYLPSFDPATFVPERLDTPAIWLQFPEDCASEFAEWVRTCPRMSGNVLLVGAPSLPDRLLLCRAAESSCVITGEDMTSSGFEEWTRFLTGGGMDLIVLFDDVPRWHVLLRYMNNQGQARANFEMAAPAGWRHHRIQAGFHTLTRRR